MKILFIPFHALSHKIPLFVLYKKYFSQINYISCAFLLSKSDYKYCEQYKIQMLDFDNIPPYSNLNKHTWLNYYSEKEKIITKFNPDIIVEDFCFHAMSFCKRNNIPRISIQRTGYFRSSDPSKRNPLHMHSGDKTNINHRRHLIFSYKKYTPKSNIFDNKYYMGEYLLNKELLTNDIHNPMIKIIPGISEIEELPSFLNNDSVQYSGPLLQEDNIDRVFHKEIERFLFENKKRKKILLTIGLIENQNISVLFEILHRKNYAVITTVLPPYEINKSHIFYTPFLPLHYISTKVDLIIHHCGSGIYHYPLLHLKPAITLGTQCYDREDIAIKLQSLKLSAHVPSPLDSIDYIDKFIDSLEKFETDCLCDHEMLIKTQKSIIETQKKYNIEEILRHSF